MIAASSWDILLSEMNSCVSLMKRVIASFFEDFRRCRFVIQAITTGVAILTNPVTR
jgi:hypothetical protein